MTASDSCLKPAATTYIVWVTPHSDKPDAKAQNMGALHVDASYAGSLDFITTFTTFDVTITPEPAPDVTAPSGRQVLKATITNQKS